MYDHQKIERSVLVDMLSAETAKLTQLLAGRRFGEDYDKCKQLIKALTKEIEARQISNITPPPDFIRE
jgi:hypothetical protein